MSYTITIINALRLSLGNACGNDDEEAASTGTPTALGIAAASGALFRLCGGGGGWGTFHVGLQRRIQVNVL